MAGEIRDGLAKLRARRQAMVASIGSEIDGVINEMNDCETDAVNALKLPRGEIAAYRQEVAEIRSEFSPKTNGGPPGPLPGSVPPSSPPPAAPVQPSPSSDDIGRTVDDVTSGRVKGV